MTCPALRMAIRIVALLNGVDSLGGGSGRFGGLGVSAITDRYKLVYSTTDDPWLFDLQEDPDERINRFSLPEYQDQNMYPP